MGWFQGVDFVSRVLCRTSTRGRSVCREGNKSHQREAEVMKGWPAPCRKRKKCCCMAITWIPPNGLDCCRGCEIVIQILIFYFSLSTPHRGIDLSHLLLQSLPWDIAQHLLLGPYSTSQEQALQFTRLSGKFWFSQIFIRLFVKKKKKNVSIGM